MMQAPSRDPLDLLGRLATHALALTVFLGTIALVIFVILHEVR